MCLFDRLSWPRFDLVIFKYSTISALLGKNTFRLRGRGHEFEFSTFSAGEKEIWMSAFREAREARPIWAPSEAPSSLFMDGNVGESAVWTYENSPLESITPLPTIQSISGLENDNKWNTPTTHERERERHKAAPTSYKPTRPSLRTDTSSKSEGLTPSRRSSTASVRQFFNATPDNEIRVDLPPKASWTQVERDMGDVINADLQAARALAEAMGQESPDRPKQYLGTTTSGVGMAGAMGVAARNKLTKRESVLVRRRRSNMDLQAEEPPVPPLPPTVSTNKLSKPCKKSKNAKPPKLDAVDIFSVNTGVNAHDVEDGGIVVNSPDAMPDSPTFVSQCSCTDASHGGSSSVSPAVDLHHQPGRVSSDASCERDGVHSEENYKPQRSRSMIDNVRGFFQQSNVSLSRTISNSRLPPISAPLSDPSPVPAGPAAQSTPTLETVRKKWRQSIRRRVGSDSKVPSAEHPTASTSEPYLPSRIWPLETIHSPGDEVEAFEGVMTPRAEERRSGERTARPRKAGEHTRHTWHIDDFPAIPGIQSFSPLENSGSFAAFMAAASAQPLVSSPDIVESVGPPSSSALAPANLHDSEPEHSTLATIRPRHAPSIPLSPPSPPPPPPPPSTTKKTSSNSRLMSWFAFSRSASDDSEA